MLYIGIDLGTSACKLLLVDESGQVRNTVTKDYPLSFPRPGWSEQEPAHWWRAAREGILELLAGFDAGEVRGIGCGGQMHGLVALDGQDDILRPAILWNDGRTAKEVDYLVYRLTGVHATDYSDASGMLLLDVEHKCWSKEMCEICGVTEDQLPKLYESWEPVGTLLPDVAQALGLPESVAVCAGAGDNAAAAVGTGTVGKGGCNISLGTSGTIFISSDIFGVDPNNALHSFAHADGGYHLMGCMLSAASCNKWWQEDILGTTDYAGEQAKILPEKLGRNHVFFLPYLMGERSPINDTNARGTFIGLTMDTTRADMLQAVLEGVAFAIRDSFEVARSLGVDIPRSNICGGGSRSPLWKTIMANVLGIPLDIVATEQGPGYGGAILAMVATGQFPSVRAACDALVSVADTVEPNGSLTALYEERYQQFRQIYPACKTLFGRLL